MKFRIAAKIALAFHGFITSHPGTLEASLCDRKRSTTRLSFGDPCHNSQVSGVIG